MPYDSQATRLAEPDAMVPAQGVVDLDVPLAALLDSFTHAAWWPRWNQCFFWARNRTLVKGQRLVWVFQRSGLLRAARACGYPAFDLTRFVVGDDGVFDTRDDVLEQVYDRPGWLGKLLFHLTYEGRPIRRVPE